MKKFIISSFVAVLAFVIIGCDTANTNTTVVNTNANMNTVNMNANANTIIVTNANTNTRADADDDWNANITREEYDKDRSNYERRAERTGSKIGTGANDLWLWTKTRATLAGVDDLRDSTINVDVENGVVTLRGSVANAAHKTAAVNAAKKVEGVSRVNDNLTVAANDSMTNQAVGTNNNANMRTNTNR